MKPLRERWQGAECRGEGLQVESLLADIAIHHSDKVAARAAGHHLRGGAPRPVDISQDMVLLYDWISDR